MSEPKKIHEPPVALPCEICRDLLPLVQAKRVKRLSVPTCRPVKPAGPFGLKQGRKTSLRRCPMTRKWYASCGTGSTAGLCCLLLSGSYGEWPVAAATWPADCFLC